MKDILGMQIELEDFVVYASYKYKKLSLEYGYVKKITDRMIGVSEKMPNPDYPDKIRMVKRELVVLILSNN